MKAYKLTSKCPDVCKVEGVEVMKFTTKEMHIDGALDYTEEMVHLGNGNQVDTKTGDNYFGCVEYFRTKEEAYARAVELAERFLRVSRGDLAVAEENLQTLLDEQLPSLFNYTAN